MYIKNICKNLFSLKNNFFKISDATKSGIISGVLAGLIVPLIMTSAMKIRDFSQSEIEEAELLSKIRIGINKEYIEDNFGIPAVEEIDEDNNLTHSFYPLKYTTVRCVYDENTIIAFFITQKSNGKVYKIPENIHCNVEKFLGELKLSDIDSNLIGNINMPASRADYLGYEEKYYGANPSNYNYILYGIYGGEKHFPDVLSELGPLNDNKDLNSQEIEKIRRNVVPNTYGEVASGYEDNTGIIPSIDMTSCFSILY